MIDSGLIALNGVPGSGKTLNATHIARKHYKKENRLYKKQIAYFKKIVFEFITNIPIYEKICKLKSKVYDYIYNKIPLYFIFVILGKFINFCLILLLFVGKSWSAKFIIIFYFFFFKDFRNKFNSLDYDYYKLFEHEKIVNVYSSYPILLDKRLNIWTKKVTLYDLMNNYSFLPNSLIIIDETQLYIDSDEYSDKKTNKIIGKIAKFLQAHRHFGIKEIIFTSQSPTRIFKKARNIIVGYLKQNRILKIPFTQLAVMFGILYYDFEYYGHYIPKDKEERRKLPFAYKKVIEVFNINKVYEAYDSKYLSLYNYTKPLLDRGSWTDFKVPEEVLKMLFEDDGIEGVQKHEASSRACTFKKKDSVT